jgi:glycosyltransferase involved in cell wall biosynthesis/GT2 family glycosyltransferase
MRPTAVVGIHAHAEPARLAETVRSLRADRADGAEIVLLPDGPDTALVAALKAEPELAGLPQWGTAESLGPPACFNRLAARSDAAVVVLVESGTVLGPGCLALLLQALDHPGRGLAGPSTNRSWNEQGVFSRAVAADVARTAAMARRRFGAAARSLEPLHSLADFCLAVRRPVIEAVGGADEEYGLGPCWEMDYNIRAARAGFTGVWVGAAYAYRHPHTGRRRAAEADLMDRSRRLYQDRVCGLRLSGQRLEYEDHCRGEACEHFAPAALLTLARPLEAPGPAAARRVERVTRPEPPPLRAAVTAKPALPLVTAIMPTRDRPEFALQAIRYFAAQDYPNKELVVLENGDPALAGRLPGDPRIRYVATGAAARSIGAMRNEACRLARGDIVAHWDDDDWYGPGRLTRQVAPILAGEADITALRDSLMLDLAAWRFWRCQPQLHRRLFVRDVHGGTLVYRRRVWEEKAQFPDRSLAEDAVFLDQAVRRGARLRPVEAAGIFVYVRHGANAWHFACGLAGGAAGWQPAAEPDFPAEERAFYAVRSAAARQHGGIPLVSCVMPTFDRRSFVPQAIRYFLRQDYPAKELIVVDDGPEPVADLLPPDPRVVYHRLERRTVLGAKRNLACDLARGSFIAHWDDDDWASPQRLSVQLDALTEGDADVCGVASLLCYDPASSSAWRFTWPDGRRPWAAGNSLCFAKDLWARSPFPEVAIGEDTRFVFSPAVRRVADVRASDCVVGIIHRRNTAPKSVRGAHWSPRPVREVADLLGDDMAFYRRLAAATPGEIVSA